jgi:hypothetical protein
MGLTVCLSDVDFAARDNKINPTRLRLWHAISGYMRSLKQQINCVDEKKYLKLLSLFMPKD